MIDYIGLAFSVVSRISPFLPYLKSLGTNVKEKLEDTIVEKAGELVSKQAETLWNKLKSLLKNDPEMEAQSNLLSTAPKNKMYQDLLTQSLAKKLESNPELAQELLKIMGGEAGVQKVIAGNDAQIEGIRQNMASSGTQTLEVGDRAIIKDVDQEMGFNR